MADLARCNRCFLTFPISEGFPVYCPHCGTGLETLPEEPAAPETDPQPARKRWGFWRWLAPDWLWDSIAPGTNTSGLVILLACGLVLFEWAGIVPEFLLVFLMAGSVFLADWLFRRLLGSDFLDYERGARLAYLPLWIWAIIWFVVGIVKGVIWLFGF
jgi:hypothetical protein